MTWPGVRRSAVGLLTAAIVVGCSGTAPDPAPDEPGSTAIGDPDAVTGLRPGADPPEVIIDGTDGGPIDALAGATLADLAAFWSEPFAAAERRPLRGPARLVSWDSTATGGQVFCGAPADGVVNAGYCAAHDEIGWDREVLMGTIDQRFGPLAVVTVLAHEYGHVLQNRIDPSAVRHTPTVVLEQQADCYAGAFVRHVVAGDAEHLSASSTDGLDQALWTMVGTRDDPDDDYFSGSEHGTAFERITAFTVGFDDGPEACADIDADHVDRVRGQVPEAMLFGRGAGERGTDPQNLEAVAESLAAVLAPGEQIRIDTTGTDVGCGPVRTIAYCPETAVLGVDPAGLAVLAEPAGPGPAGGVEVEAGRWSMPTTLVGEFTPLAVFASRYALAVLDARGEPVLGADAAAQATCLTGAWVGALARGQVPPGSPPGAAPYDLDETVAALLDDGPIGTDAVGGGDLSGYVRLVALRTGVLGGQQACTDLQ